MIIDMLNSRAEKTEIDLVEAAQPEVIIRPVANAAELKMVHRLTHDCYVAKGYCKPQPNGLLSHYPEFDASPQTTVFIAIRAGSVVGSISMTLDGPLGLTVDKDFNQECNAMRQSGRKIGCAWRLVMQHSMNPSRQILMNLIKAIATLGLRYGSDTWLFTVKPRHETIYHRMRRMYTVARKETTLGLTNAPAVFLRCDVENLPPTWKTIGSGPIMSHI